MPDIDPDPFGLSPAPAPDAMRLTPLSVQTVPKQQPAPVNSLNLADFPSEDLQAVISIAADAGIVKADIPTAEAIAQIEAACAPYKKNGEVFIDFSRARQALRYLILRSNGMRTKDAILGVGLKNWAPVGQLRAHNKAYKNMYDVAEDRFFAAVHPEVVDSLVEAAVKGDSIRKFKDGEKVSEVHRANVRAQELLLKATDPRFRESDTGVVASGGVTYNIGSINVAQLPAGAGGVPALAPAKTVLIEGEKGGFSADKVAMRIGNHA